MATLPSPPFSVALFGAGRVGTAVAMQLRLGGHEVVGVRSRTPSSARTAAHMLGSEVVEEGDPVDANLFLIGAGGTAIGSVAERLASSQSLDGAVVCHFSGADGTSVLRTVVEAGAAACAIHPVQSCPDVDTAIERLPGSAWGVTTTPGAEEWASRLVGSHLRGTPISVAEDIRPAWHAAAVVTSNGIAALIAAGEALLSDIGIAEPSRVLGPLAIGTATNAMEGGGGAATLTGPVVRGEAETIRSHLNGLADLAQQHSDGYKKASELVLQVALESKRIDPATAARIAEVLR